MTSTTSWWPSRKGRQLKAQESKPKWYRTLAKLSAAKHNNSHLCLKTDETSLKMPRGWTSRTQTWPLTWPIALLWIASSGKICWKQKSCRKASKNSNDLSSSGTVRPTLKPSMLPMSQAQATSHRRKERVSMELQGLRFASRLARIILLLRNQALTTNKVMLITAWCKSTCTTICHPSLIRQRNRILVDRCAKLIIRQPVEALDQNTSKRILLRIWCAIFHQWISLKCKTETIIPIA